MNKISSLKSIKDGKETKKIIDIDGLIFSKKPKVKGKEQSKDK